MKLPIDKNIIYVNDREQDVLSGALEKEGIYYVPITVMKKIYETYIELLRNVLNMFAKRNLRSKVTINISYMMDKTISKYNEKYNKTRYTNI